MTTRLKLRDIVARVDLDRRTAKYVLDRARVANPLRLPESEGERSHRSFTVDEAIRLAVCTHLTMLGIQVGLAEQITVWAESRWRALSGGTSEPLFDGSASNPWNLDLVSNGKYVKFSRPRPDRRNDQEHREDIDDYFHIDEWKLERFAAIPRGIPLITWSLTHLSAELAAAERRR